MAAMDGRFDDIRNRLESLSNAVTRLDCNLENHIKNSNDHHQFIKHKTDSDKENISQILHELQRKQTRIIYALAISATAILVLAGKSTGVIAKIFLPFV